MPESRDVLDVRTDSGAFEVTTADGHHYYFLIEGPDRVSAVSDGDVITRLRRFRVDGREPVIRRGQKMVLIRPELEHDPEAGPQDRQTITTKVVGIEPLPEGFDEYICRRCGVGYLPRRGHCHDCGAAREAEAAKS